MYILYIYIYILHVTLTGPLNTLHDFRLPQMKVWHCEAIVMISGGPRLFHDANLLSGKAENRAVCVGL